MELSVNPGPKPIGHVIQASIALQRYKIIRYLQIKMTKKEKEKYKKQIKKWELYVKHIKLLSCKNQREWEER